MSNRRNFIKGGVLGAVGTAIFPKLISAIAMFYDLPDPINFIKLIENKLNKNGIFHVEVAYLSYIFKKFSFDTFCQEHLTYYSLNSFENLIKKTNLKILDFEKNTIITSGKKYIKIVRDNCVWGFIVKEDFKHLLKGDILKAAGYKKFAMNAARGNVLEGNFGVVWTGANYLR